MKLMGPDGVVDVPLAGVEVLPDGTLRTPEGTFRVAVARDGDAVWVSFLGETARFERVQGDSERAGMEVRAPMTGRVVAVAVKAGDEVKTGDLLAILEAMKMEYRLEAPADATVGAVKVAAGDLVELGQLLVDLS